MSDTGISLTEPTFYGTIRTAIEDGKSPEEAAELVMRSEAFRDRMRTVIAQVARSMARQETREAEKEFQYEWKQGNVRTAVKTILGHGFFLPSGDYVEWMTATTAQHLARAQWQRRSAEAQLRDAQLHEVAADVIKKHGKTCLGDFDTLAPWPELEAEATKEIEAG